MTKHFLALPLLAAGLSLAQPGPALAQAAPAITTSQDEIAYEEFTLPNGLRVVVHEDHSVPKVAVRGTNPMASPAMPTCSNI